MRGVSFAVSLIALAWVAALVSGCGPVEQPRLRTVGVVQPSCVFWCRGFVDASDGKALEGVTVQGVKP